MASAELSTQTGVAVATVKRWLRCTFEPRYKNLTKIACTLHVSADYLCGIDP